MLWISVIYIASLVFCLTTFKQAIEEGIEDGDVDDIHADLMHGVSRIISFIPLLNSVLSLVILYIYAPYVLSWIYDWTKYYKRYWMYKSRRTLRRFFR